MSVQDWLLMARTDAERRGLDALAPLLDGLAPSLQALRDAAARMDQDGPDQTTGPEEAPATADATKRAAGTADLSDGAPGMADLARRLSQGSLKAEHLVEACLERIAARQPALNAFITVTADEALAAARQADGEMAAGRPRGPLHGIPLSLKDLIDQAGVPTTAASRVRVGHRADADAPVTSRLRAAGAIFVGKTNLHEFAFGTTSEDSGFGAARHPLDAGRSPGGSSGGSAIAVATGMSVGSVGTDTG
ncbi:MAG: amidase, partial [Acidobacteriota bacterium]|nr:amidase [Acidobacteriota bacterium]